MKNSVGSVDNVYINFKKNTNNASTASSLDGHHLPDVTYSKHVALGVGCPQVVPISGPYSQPAAQSRKRQLLCYGANIRSLYSLENNYGLHKILEDKSPDLFFLVETWHQESNIKALQNKRYATLFSPCDDTRGGGVAIIHRTDFIVTLLFPEFHSRNFLLARVSSVSAFPVLLVCAYFPPDHMRRRQMISHFARVLDHLRSRYASFGLIFFGDLNADLVNDSGSPLCTKFSRLMRFYGLETHAVREPGSYTREQCGRSSYLDYFLTSGVEVKELSLRGEIGASDHRSISCVIGNFDPVRRRRNKFFSKVRARQLLNHLVYGVDSERLLSQSALPLFLELSSRLKLHSVVFEPRPRSYFRAIAMVEDEIRGLAPNWN